MGLVSAGVVGVVGVDDKLDVGVINEDGADSVVLAGAIAESFGDGDSGEKSGGESVEHLNILFIIIRTSRSFIRHPAEN